MRVNRELLSDWSLPAVCVCDVPAAAAGRVVLVFTRHFISCSVQLWWLSAAVGAALRLIQLRHEAQAAARPALR